MLFHITLDHWHAITKTLARHMILWGTQFPYEFTDHLEDTLASGRGQTTTTQTTTGFIPTCLVFAGHCGPSRFGSWAVDIQVASGLFWLSDLAAPGP